MVRTSWKMNKPLSRAVWCERWQRGCRRAVTSAIQPFVALHRDPTRQPFSANASVTASTGAQNMHEADQAPDRGNLGGHVGRNRRHACCRDIQNDAPPLMKAMPRLIEKCIKALGRLRPLICIGDSAEEKRWQVSRESVVRQMKIALYGLEPPAGAAGPRLRMNWWAIGEHGCCPPFTAGGGCHSSGATSGALRAVWSAEMYPYPAALWRQRNAQNAVGIGAAPAGDQWVVYRRAAWTQGYCDIVQRVTQEFILQAQ